MDKSYSNDEIIVVPVQVVVQQKENKPSRNRKVHTEYKTLPKLYRNNHSAGVNEMAKRIKCKIRNQRKNQPTTPNTKAAFAKLFANIVNK